MATDLERLYADFAQRYLRRPIRAADGVQAGVVKRAEDRVGRKLPLAVRKYYECLGSVGELNRAHNVVFAPDQLAIEGGYLMFMDENQCVVSWGIRLEDLEADDPEVWQRNNTPPEAWYSEEKSFTELMTSMFDWYVEVGVLAR